MAVVFNKNNKVARIGSIVIFKTGIGTNMRIVTATRPEQYGIIGARLDSGLGRKLYLSEVGKIFDPYSGTPSPTDLTKIENIFTIKEIENMILMPDSLKENTIIGERDIVLTETNDDLRIYRTRGNAIEFVAGLRGSEQKFKGEKIGSTVSLKNGKVKVLGSITEKTFRNRLVK